MDRKELYHRFDSNKNGELSEEEIMSGNELLEIELREEKANTQRRLAWVATWSMILFTIFLFLPIVSDSRVDALAELLGLFYLAQAGIIGAYMGFTTWMSK
jgi:ABC-type multidrug transport system permease subunit